MMTPLILKGCKSVQYFITQQQKHQATLSRPGSLQGGNTLCSGARSPAQRNAHRAYRKHGSSPCASWLIQCEWCNNSQLHEGGKHGVGSNTTRVVPRWRRCCSQRRRHSVQWRQSSAKLVSDGHKNTRGPHPFV
jgi:hypothetical protein